MSGSPSVSAKAPAPRSPAAVNPVRLPGAGYFRAEPEIAEAAAQWIAALAHERRASRHTIDGYARDVAGFLNFLTDHFGAPPDAAALRALAPADLRAWLDRTATVFADRILPFGAEEARVWGRLTHQIGHAGADLMIAATAFFLRPMSSTWAAVRAFSTASGTTR